MSINLKEVKAKLTNLRVNLPGIHFYSDEQIETEMTEIFTPEELDIFNYIPSGKLPQNAEALSETKDAVTSQS